MRRILLLFLLSALLISCTTNNDKKKLTIAVIPKGTTHEFWKSIHAGSNKAAQELTAQGTEIEVIWKGPLREDDREQQIQVVEGFAAQGVSGIVLAPLDDRALVRPVTDARRAGVPTVIIDSGLESEEIVSFVATDNYKGGTLAADRMGQLLGGKGKVMVLRYAVGSASTMPLTPCAANPSTTWICCSRSSSRTGPFQITSTLVPCAVSSCAALLLPA